MTTQELAERLVVLCRQAHFEAAQKELYGKDVVSIEPHGAGVFDKETTGIEAVNAKISKFNNIVQEVHKIEVSEPLVVANSFSCTMRMDLTMKEGGHMDMTELCVYEVKDGRIIKEMFFF